MVQRRMLVSNNFTRLNTTDYNLHPDNLPADRQSFNALDLRFPSA
jgi:hypothetical protein